MLLAYIKNKNYIIVTLIICILLFISSTAYAAIPHLISVQGRVIDKTSGLPLTSAIQFKFIIYDEPIAGINLWESTHTITPDRIGSFDVLLGSINPLDLSFNKSYYLEVEINGEVLIPRYDMTSSAYAYGLGASNLSGPLTVNGLIESTIGGFKLPDGTIIANENDLKSNQWTTNGNNIYNTNPGSVGIGTTTPTAGTKLDVVGNIDIDGDFIIDTASNDAQICLNGYCISSFAELASLSTTWGDSVIQTEEIDYCETLNGPSPASWSYYDVNRSGNCMISRTDNVVVTCPTEYTSLETQTISRTAVSCYDGRCTGGWACTPHYCTTGEHWNWETTPVERCIRNDCWARYGRRAGSNIYATVKGTRCTHI